MSRGRALLSSNLAFLELSTTTVNDSTYSVNHREKEKVEIRCLGVELG